MEDATGVVRTLSGTAIGHVGADGGIVPVPADGGAADGAAATCTGWKVDQTTRALLDGNGRVLGTVAARRDGAADMEGCPQHGVAAAAAAPGLEVMDGVREDLGLLWGGDGQVVGTCVAHVVAGMAIVSTAGKVIGDVGQDGTVLGKNGAALIALIDRTPAACPVRCWHRSQKLHGGEGRARSAVVDGGFWARCCARFVVLALQSGGRDTQQVL